MKRLFADTSYFIALLYPKDKFHRSAVNITDGLEVPLITTQWVMAELGNFMCIKGQRTQFLKCLKMVQSGYDNLLLGADDQSFWAGVRLYESRNDKEWSLVDCISFAVMDRFGLRDALSADHHFQQAGYHALLLNN